MNKLSKKINFVLWVEVVLANPNGDPLADNRPRTDFDGRGLMSGVCIRRKIRNRLQDMMHNIYIQTDQRADDGAKDLKERAKDFAKIKDKDEFMEKACERWTDVRSFGQVLPFSDFACKSVGVYGPVTINHARTADPINIIPMQITKSVSGERKANGEKGSDTMGMEYLVEYGLYKIKGSINAYRAQKTGLTEGDVEAIKKSLATLFENDDSAARPEGSMRIVQFYWFEHNGKEGQYPAFDVFESVKARKKDGVRIPNKLDDYIFEFEELPGLKSEVVIDKTRKKQS